jgi:hypothetical protein
MRVSKGEVRSKKCGSSLKSRDQRRSGCARSNIVHAADTTGLAVITQLQPITVVFTIPEDSLPQVMKKLHAGERLVVDAYDREQKNKLATGYLLTADNQIDPTTGTVRLKAKFDNESGALFPNQFVNARLLLNVKKDATVIPAVAVQRGTQGAYVYVVKPDQTVAARQVTVGPTQGDDIAIDNGVEPGELVVVEGADKLKDGTKVDLQSGDSGSRPQGASDGAGINLSGPFITRPWRLVAHGRAVSRRRSRVSSTAGVSSASGRLSDHSSRDVLPVRARCRGLLGDGSARAPVRAMPDCSR